MSKGRDGIGSRLQRLGLEGKIATAKHSERYRTGAIMDTGAVCTQKKGANELVTDERTGARWNG